MKFNRKDFLKFAGLTTVAGLGSTALGEILAPGALDASTGAGEEKSDRPSKKQWAMVVDMSKCEDGCNDCTKACRDVHNVPSIPNLKHEIKWLWKEEYKSLFPEQASEYSEEGYNQKPFLTLCNHCENPPCVRVCPTQATFKSKSDGIVMMDFHRCIGCRFCMAGCPYGSRSFNFEDPRKYLKKDEMNPEFPTRMKGVVEKCNFCDERLKHGDQPACVETCKNGALIFGDLYDPESEVRKILKTNYSVRRKPQLGTEPSVFYIIK